MTSPSTHITHPHSLEPATTTLPELDPFTCSLPARTLLSHHFELSLVLPRDFLSTPLWPTTFELFGTSLVLSRDLLVIPSSLLYFHLLRTLPLV